MPAPVDSDLTPLLTYQHFSARPRAVDDVIETLEVVNFLDRFLFQSDAILTFEPRVKDGQNFWRLERVRCEARAQPGADVINKF